MATIVRDFFYTGLWASGYIWSNPSPREEAQSFPVFIRDIELIGDESSDKFTLFCKTVRMVANGKKFKKMDPFKIKGEYKVHRNEYRHVKSVELYIHNKFYTIQTGACVSLPIPNGEAFFCFTSNLPEPDYNLTPEFFQQTDAEKQRVLQESPEYQQLVDQCLEEFPVQYDDESKDDEFDFETLFD